MTIESNPNPQPISERARAVIADSLKLSRSAEISEAVRHGASIAIDPDHLREFHRFIQMDTDAILAALDAAGLVIRERGEVCVSAHDAEAIRRVCIVSDHQWTGRVRNILNTAIAATPEGE